MQIRYMIYTELYDTSWYCRFESIAQQRKIEKVMRDQDGSNDNTTAHYSEIPDSNLERDADCYD